MERCLPLLILLLLPFDAWAQCDCPDGIGSREGDKPFLSFASPDGERQIILCGFVEKTTGPDSLLASEFEVVPCDTGQSVLTFGARQTCRVDKRRESLLITTLAWLPYGQGWQWLDVAYDRHSIRYDDENELEIETSFAFRPPEISRTRARDILAQYDKQIEDDNLSEDSIFKLLAVALNGNQQAEDRLLQMMEKINLDGHLAELHDQAMDIYHRYQEERPR